MSTFTVGNQAQLLSALSSAKGGDSIVLKDGHYGSMRITKDFASNVTIRAEHEHGAKIGKLEVFGASNLTFDGIDFSSGGNGGTGRGIISVEYDAANIAIVNSKIHGSADGQYQGHYGVYVRNSNNITVQGNDIHDVNDGIVIFGSKGSSISNNKIDYVGRDMMKFAGLHDSEIVENIGGGHHYAQPSNVHTDFIQFQGSSSNVHIDGNVYIALTRPDVQGIFANDGVYKNLLIENNIIYTGMIRGISVSQGSGIVVQNNTLLNIPGEIHKSTLVIVPGGSIVENNIVGTKGAGGTFGSNITLQNSNADGAYYVGDYFVNGGDGRGITLDDLSPVRGSLAETKGAAARLKELLGGTSPEPTKPTPTEPGPGTPEPTMPKPAPVDPDAEIAINAGGPSVSDFARDAGFSGGKLFSSKASIAKTNDDVLYQTERYGNFEYEFAVENGTYDVTLKFAEIYWNAAGKRIFDVKAENKLVLDNVDVFRMAGGKNVAWDRTIEVEVRDGRLELEFISVRDKAKISGIEIEPHDPGSDGFDLML